MSKKTEEIQDTKLQTLEETLSRTERYIEDNQKFLMMVIAAIVVVVGGYLAYQRFYVKQKEADAQSQMFVAEQYFEKDSLKLALKGDGNYSGFLEIIDQYGSTKAGNLAHYYAGIVYLRMGDYDNAIKQLGEFDSDDHLVAPVATGAMGDAYMEKGNTKEAVEQYLKAARQDENQFTTPIFLMKAAQALESLNDKPKAIELYQQIKENYPKSNEGRKVEKYIARLQAK